jgi:putative tricarboxylic transport membrane protein
MPQRSWGAVAVAVGLLLLGLFVGYETTVIPTTPIYAKVGPKVFPFLIAGGMVLIGAALFRYAWTGAWQPEEQDDAGPPDWRALGWLGFGLVFNVAFIQILGFILASTVLFVAVARAFGSRKLARDLAIAFVFAAVCYFGFVRVLGINMGAGLLEGLI